MKVVDVVEATSSLSEYAQRNRREAVVVVRRGKPISALVPLDSKDDLETLTLSADPRFQAILARGRAQVRAGQVISAADMGRIFGVGRKRR